MTEVKTVCKTKSLCFYWTVGTIWEYGHCECKRKRCWEFYDGCEKVYAGENVIGCRPNLDRLVCPSYCECKLIEQKDENGFWEWMCLCRGGLATV